MAYLAENGLSCDMLIYFNRPEQLRNYSYTEVFKCYVVNTDLLHALKNHRTENDGYYTINLTFGQRYLTKRARGDCIVRMGDLLPTFGEIWYLKQILLHSQPFRINDAYSFNGIHYNTLQETAYAMGIVTHNDEGYLAFTAEAYLPNANPYELRGLFCTLMLSGLDIMKIFNEYQCIEAMISDYLMRGLNFDRGKNEMLKDFNRRISSQHRSLTDFGLPLPQDDTTELEIEKLEHNQTDERRKLNELNRQYPNNVEQEHIFREITNSIDNDHDDRKFVFFFVNGGGGTGKTTLAKKIIAYSRSKGKICKVTASITLASTLYDGATTIHALFKYPVLEEGDTNTEEEDVKCKVQPNSQRMELLNNMDIIIMDEFPSIHRAVFEAAIDLLKNRKKRLIVWCAGDFRQTLPIVQSGNYKDVIAATVSSSCLWSKFQIFNLTQNMRLTKLRELSLRQCDEHNLSATEREDIQLQLNYAASIQCIGELRENPHCTILDRNEDNQSCKVRLPLFKFYKESQIMEALNWLYPNREFNPIRATVVSILAATNTSVNKWNTVIQDLNPNDVIELKSNDYFSECDDPHGILQRLLDHTALDKFDSNNAPPHTLRLKLNDICLITRPIIAQNVPSNARVRITHINKYYIRAELLTGRVRLITIPRMSFNFRLKYGHSFKLHRRQFPLKLAYAVTFNKSQSQTLSTVLLDCTEEPFSHGHLYVGGTRITDANNIKLMIRDDMISEDGSPVITNIVYESIIRQIIGD